MSPVKIETRQRWRTRTGIAYTIDVVSGSGPDATARVVLDDGEMRGPWLQSRILADEYLGRRDPETLIYTAAGGMHVELGPEGDLYGVWMGGDIIGTGYTVAEALADARRFLVASRAERSELRHAAQAVRNQLKVLEREVDQMERAGAVHVLRRWRAELQALLAHHFSM